MKILFELILSGTISITLIFILIPILKKVATVIGLVDKPNHRKVHTELVPLVGGIAIVLSTFFALLLSSTFVSGILDVAITIGGGIILLLTGSIDDKMDISPIYRLIIQLGCAFAVASTGIRITSFYGILGIYEISIIWQYLFTLLIITGVVNAFNLMDGIDGLAGGLALVGFSVFAVLSYIISDFTNLILFVTLASSTLGFLKFNLSKKKIFLGDSGALFLGFMLVVSGINIIEKTNGIASCNQPLILLAVISIFLLPVLDSLRVYSGRIMNGLSPFTPDKSHIHHLFLLLNLSHRQIAYAVISISLLILLQFIVLIKFLPLTLVLVLGTLSFFFFTTFLNINKKVREWSLKIRRIENH